MHTVVVDMHRHSQDVHWWINGEDEQNTVIGVRIHIPQVVYRTSFQPCTVDLEPDAWQIVAALSDDNTLGLVIDPIWDSSVLKYLDHQVLVVKGWDHKSWGTSIDDRVQGIILLIERVLIGLLICECIAYNTNGNARVHGGPEEIVFKHLGCDGNTASFVMLEGGFTKVDEGSFIGLLEVEWKFVGVNNFCIGQLLDEKRSSDVTFPRSNEERIVSW